jgi:cytochrome b561
MDLPDNKPTTTAATWHYGALAIALHWIIATLIIGLVGLGWYMLSVEKQAGARALFDLHKSLGLTVFGLIVLRILWRTMHPPEGLPVSVPVWQAKISNLIHWALYACMIIMPVTGYLGAAHQKAAPKFFGFSTPAWATPNRALAEQFFTAHSITVWVLVALISLHTLAGLKHLLIDKDRVFQRMWFNRVANPG